MKIGILSLAVLLSLAGVSAQTTAPDLNQTILEISFTAAKLSSLAYINTNTSGFTTAGLGYDEIVFYTDEPDQAIVAKKDGRCYLAFRGTNANLADWHQNADLSSRDIYLNNDTTTEPCEVRAGFADFLDTDPVAQGLADLKTCMDTCTDPCDCLVITGHSQGGAVSTIVSILLNSYCPRVITFGQPPAADAGCPYIPGDRILRFVNSKEDDESDGDINFDPVPFAPNFISKSKHYGHYLQLGEDPTSVKYLGLDQNFTLGPSFWDEDEAAAHSMDCLNGTLPFSYECRMQDLLNTSITTKASVSTDGWANGVVCEAQYSELCATGRCADNICKDKLAELCSKQSCQFDSNCASDSCIYGACAAGPGQVEADCPCEEDENCKSNDCDFTSYVNPLDWACAASGVADLEVKFTFVAVGFVMGLTL